MDRKMYLWKSLKKGKKSDHGNHKWKVGKWYNVEGNLSMCGNGFHASENIVDAMRYVNMEHLAKVEVRGSSLKQNDKQCWSEMRVVKTWKWERENSIRLAIYAASLVLKIYEDKYPGDKRPREAIRAAKNYLKAKDKKSATDAVYAVYAAAYVADAAAYAAARTAYAATYAATYAADAAAHAVYAAARVAAHAAYAVYATDAAAYAARIEIKLKCHNWVLRRVKK